MISSIPTVEAYYISLKKDNEEKKSSLEVASNTISMAYDDLQIRWLSNLPEVGAVIAGFWEELEEMTSVSIAVLKLRRLSDDGHFKVIRSQEELSEFENANGNAWISDDKTLAQRQYYIRHPKLKNRRLLIESKDFQSYIEEEQKDELLDFIFSHCSPKSIIIDRVAEKSTEGKIKGNIKAVKPEAGVDFRSKQGNYYNFQNPNGAPRKAPRDSYLWLEPSLMRSIEALTEGAKLTQTYERDFTFGLTAGEAKTLGLSVEEHKKYLYKITIEC